MKLSLPREKFHHSFQTAASVAPTRTPRPVLATVKIICTEDKVTLLGTDMEIGVRVEMSGMDVQAPGVALLPIRRVGPILREAQDETVQVESDGSKVILTGARFEFQLPIPSPDEFPTVAEFDFDKYQKFQGRVLREMIVRTVFATDPESGRYALGGVLLDVDDGEVVAVATDGRRLARQTGSAENVGGFEGEKNTIVPTRAMQLIARILGEAEGEALFASRDNAVLVKYQNTTVYSRLLEGRYPRWREIIPKYSDAVEVQVPVGGFHSAVRQAAIVADTERRSVDLHFGDGKIVFSTHGAELGESRIEMPVSYEGREVIVKLDPQYVSEFLRVLDEKAMITIRLQDNESAVVFETDDGYMHVVMPLAA